MPRVDRLAGNVLSGVKRSLWLAWGWVRASLQGVRLGAGASVSPKANVSQAYFLGAVSVASGVTIGRGSYVNSGSVDSGEIGAWCSIGYGVHIGPTEHRLSQWTMSPVLMAACGTPGASTDEPVAAPIIGHDVWIGSHVIVLRGVRIGTGSVIGAGAVVCQDIPAYSVAVGVPARVVKPRFSDPGERLQAEQALARALGQHGFDGPCNPD